jgi:hypothetical protein
VVTKAVTRVGVREPEEGPVNRLESWFLTNSERGNDFSGFDRRRAAGLGWSTGNRVETLVHGATYFGRLLGAVRDRGAGDQQYFTDWRGDPDERLSDDPDSEVDLRIQPTRTTTLWAEPFYRTIYDPDARTPKMRREADW